MAAILARGIWVKMSCPHICFDYTMKIEFQRLLYILNVGISSTFDTRCNVCFYVLWIFNICYSGCDVKHTTSLCLKLLAAIPWNAEEFCPLTFWQSQRHTFLTSTIIKKNIVAWHVCLDIIDNTAIIMYELIIVVLIVDVPLNHLSHQPLLWYMQQQRTQKALIRIFRTYTWHK